MNTVDIKIDHPNYNYCTNNLGRHIAVFRLDYYEQVPAEVEAAWIKILHAVNKLDTEKSLIREWGGNITAYAPGSQVVKVELTQEMIDNMVKSVEDAGYTVCDKWPNSSHGLCGYSIAFVKD